MPTDTIESAGSPAAPSAPKVPRHSTTFVVASTASIVVVLLVLVGVILQSTRQPSSVNLGYQPTSAAPAQPANAAPKGGALKLSTGCPVRTLSSDRRVIAQNYLEIIQAAWPNHDTNCLASILTDPGQAYIIDGSPVGPGTVNVRDVAVSSASMDTVWDVTFTLGSDSTPRYATVTVTTNGGVTTFDSVPDFHSSPSSDTHYSGF